MIGEYLGNLQDPFAMQVLQWVTLDTGDWSSFLLLLSLSDWFLVLLSMNSISIRSRSTSRWESFNHRFDYRWEWEADRHYYFLSFSVLFICAQGEAQKIEQLMKVRKTGWRVLDSPNGHHRVNFHFLFRSLVNVIVQQIRRRMSTRYLSWLSPSLCWTRTCTAEISKWRKKCV